jgi:membrane protein
MGPPVPPWTARPIVPPTQMPDPSRISGLPGKFLRRLRSAWSILVTAVHEFLELRAMESGASIAFYALFSLFPLLILLVSLLGFILEQEEVQGQVRTFLQEWIPFSQDEILSLVEQNLNGVIHQRGPASLLAVLGLFWAGSSVFSALVRSINLAWHTTAAPMNFLQGRLIGLTLILVLVALVLASFITNTTLTVLARLDDPFGIGEMLRETSFWLYLTDSLPYLSSFLLFTGLYRWVPNTRVRWLEAGIAGLVATTAWHIAIAGYTWALREGLLNYQLVYGSLATVVITMVWIFLSSLILLFGAYLSAAIARHRGEPGKTSGVLPTPAEPVSKGMDGTEG